MKPGMIGMLKSPELSGPRLAYIHASTSTGLRSAICVFGCGDYWRILNHLMPGESFLPFPKGTSVFVKTRFLRDRFPHPFSLEPGDYSSFVSQHDFSVFMTDQPIEEGWINVTSIA